MATVDCGPSLFHCWYNADFHLKLQRVYLGAQNQYVLCQLPQIFSCDGDGPLLAAQDYHFYYFKWLAGLGPHLLILWRIVLQTPHF